MEWILPDVSASWSGGAKEERQWVQQALNTLVSVRNTGLIAIVSRPNGGSLTFSWTLLGKIGTAALHDVESNEDICGPLRTALSEKNKQASGNLVWLRLGEYAGLWHWSRYRMMKLEEKV